MATTQINGSYQIQDASIPSGKVDSTIIISAGTHAFASDQSMGGNKLTNLATPTSAADAATKQYVDTAIQGLNQKPTARVATTAVLSAVTYANGSSGVGATLTGNANNTNKVIDGVTLALNDVVLIKDQAAPAQNGLYTYTQVADSSHPCIFTRHVDMDTSGEFDGAFIPVDNEGTANANTLWLVNNLGTVTVGTTAVTFTQLAAPTSYTGSGGVVITGTVITVTYGTTSSTVCQGNDSRLSDARTPVGSALTSTKIWVGDGSNTAQPVNLSGDGTLANTGALTLDSTKIMRFSKYAPRETPSGTVNGSNTDFTLAHTPISGMERVCVNGIEQDAGSGNDYTISSAVITFLTGAIPQTGDKVRVTYWY